MKSQPETIQEAIVLIVQGIPFSDCSDFRTNTNICSIKLPYDKTLYIFSSGSFIGTVDPIFLSCRLIKPNKKEMGNSVYPVAQMLYKTLQALNFNMWPFTEYTAEGIIWIKDHKLT